MLSRVAAVAPLLKLEVRHFPTDKEGEAWRWLGAAPLRRGLDAA
ncbi:hypothetical protein [Allosphingosinicella sp.]